MNTYTVKQKNNRQIFTNFKAARACAWRCAKTSSGKVLLTKKVGRAKMEVLREYSND